ncbi:VOC family protein [Miniimonas sp. S16]|uniref:VOC family protein n=1 Tax=Miniimonas sp. S16 TaxID=2171623 RepID=UPI000D526603|nr:VOC family protein [Miniimonas sp. S16]
MTLAIGMITVDSTDPVPLAHWWARVLEGEVVAENEGWFVVVTTTAGTLGFQRVDAVTPGKNKVHLDLTTHEDLALVAGGLLAAGATLVGERAEGAARWFTLADPQGNEFCVAHEG